MKNTWLAMILPKSSNPCIIRSYMKISAQLVGPKDDQQKLELDLSDFKGNQGNLLLPPQLNPEV